MKKTNNHYKLISTTLFEVYSARRGKVFSFLVGKESIITSFLSPLNYFQTLIKGKNELNLEEL